MTKIELLEQIVKKQDELINWFDSDLESGDALIRLQLSILKKQLEECENNYCSTCKYSDKSFMIELCLQCFDVNGSQYEPFNE